MRKETVKAKRKNTAKTDKSSESPNTDTQDDVVFEEIDQDDWAELFDDDSEGSVVVQLQRTQPDIVIRDPESGADCRTAGYCEDLSPGLPSYLDHIKRLYGGGIYRVQRRVNGVVRNQKYVHIQGRPLFGLDKPPANEATPGKAETSLPDEKIDDVSIGGTDGEFEKRLERLVILKNLLRDPEPRKDDSDLLSVLLKHTLEQKNPDPLSQIQTLSGVLDVVKGLMPEQGTGASWEDILNTLVKTFGARLAARPGSANLLSGPGSVVDRSTTGRMVGKTVGKTQAEHTDTEGKEMQEKVAIREMAGLAVANIIASFRLDPPKEPERVVTTLDLSLNMEKEDRAKLQSYYEALYDLAEIQLEGDFAEHPQQREEFKAYFKKVFDDYVRADREETRL